MPCAYAHKRFGDQVLPDLPRQEREAVMSFKELFDLGLHGPDILFYHSLLPSDKVAALGREIHHRSGLETFRPAWDTAESGGAMYKAYLYGVLCHFALDCMCHGTVNRAAREQGLTHSQIEMEFDRFLTVEDGHDPLRFDTAAHIVPSRRNAAVAAAFYPGVDVRDVIRSLKNMKFCLRTLLAPDMVKRRALLAAFKAVGQGGRTGLIMSLEPDPRCLEITRRLLELYKLAIPLAIKLISEADLTARGKLEPDRHLALTFHSEMPNTNI